MTFVHVYHSVVSHKVIPPTMCCAAVGTVVRAMTSFGDRCVPRHS